MGSRALRLAIVNDYPVVVAGVAALLAGEHIDVVEIDASETVTSDVDVVLFDTFGHIAGQGPGPGLVSLVRDSGAKVVVYSWNVKPEMLTQAIEGGASGYLSKALTGPQICEALERVVAGEIVCLPGEDESSVDGAGDWPGKSVGLSPREAEIIALITQGLSNDEIAKRAFLSINTVKTTCVRPTARSTSSAAPRRSCGGCRTGATRNRCSTWILCLRRCPTPPESPCVTDRCPRRHLASQHG